MFRGLIHGSCFVRRCFSSTAGRVPLVAIVGSGPAGFYTAQQILKGHETAEVDVYEQLPVPFGLVRFGIAPDHPDVKNVINTFNQVAKNNRFRYFGNVHIGQDISLERLQKAYSAVVLAYGAADDKVFGIPGEDLKGVTSARSFVAWYNGLPGKESLNPDLDTDTAVVLGQGNVAIDVARMLLMPIDVLRTTDITEHALEALSRSRIKRVFVVGRRGPLEVAFTPAELREMLKIPDCRPVFPREYFEDVRQRINEVPRARKRLTELMVKTALDAPGPEDARRWAEAKKEFHLTFLKSPLKFLPGSDASKVGAVRFSVNRLEENGGRKAVPTGQTEDFACGLVLRSIGYKSHPLQTQMPFDLGAGIVPNEQGRVTGHEGLYCSGWVKRGPVGVLVTTMNDAFETGKILVADLSSGSLKVKSNEDRDQILHELRQKEVTPVTFTDWEKIDEEERLRGRVKGKPREKICSVPEILSVLRK